MVKNNTAMLIVGVQPEAINVARDALLQFVNAEASDAVIIAAIIAALQTFKDVVSVKNINISDCNFLNK